MNKIKAIIEKNFSSTKGRAILALIAFLTLYFLHGIYVWLNSQSTDNAYLESDITFVSPEVSGVISNIYFKENQRVEKGDVLIKIKDINYKVAYEQALSANDSAILNIKIIDNEINIAKSELSKAELELKLASNDLARISSLAKDSFSSRKNYEDTTIRKTQAELGQRIAKQKLLALESKREAAILEASSAANALILAKQNYDNTEVKSPIKGVVTSSSARVGGFVSQGRYVFAVVPSDLIYVKANFKETQVKKFREGMKAEVTFDAFPGLKFDGKIRSIHPATGSKFSLIPTDTATGNFTKIVQRLPVIIDLEVNEEYMGRLAAGFSAHVKIRTDQ